jgi:hypothetical protein
MPMEGSFSPSPSGVTSTGRSCLDGPIGGPPSAQRCFDQEAVVRGGDGRVRVAHHSIPPSPEDVDLCFFVARPAAHQSLSLFMRPRSLAGGMLHLLPCGICGRVGITQLTMATPKAMCNITSIVKI